MFVYLPIDYRFDGGGGGGLANSSTEFGLKQKSLPALTGASDVWDAAQFPKKNFQKIEIVQRFYHSPGVFQIENIFTYNL